MDIYSVTKENLSKYFIDMGLKSYKATQVFEWLYSKRVKSFDEMTNLSNELRNKLNDNYSLGLFKIEKKLV